MGPLLFQCTALAFRHGHYPLVTLTRGMFVDEDADEIVLGFGDEQPPGSEWVELDGKLEFENTGDDFEVGRIYIYAIESHFSLAEDEEPI